MKGEICIKPLKSFLSGLFVVALLATVTPARAAVASLGVIDLKGNGITVETGLGEVAGQSEVVVGPNDRLLQRGNLSNYKLTQLEDYEVSVPEQICFSCRSVVISAARGSRRRTASQNVQGFTYPGVVVETRDGITLYRLSDPEMSRTSTLFDVQFAYQEWINECSNHRFDVVRTSSIRCSSCGKSGLFSQIGRATEELTYWHPTRAIAYTRVYSENSPITIRNATISGYPSWLKSGEYPNQKLIFENCTFTVPVPAYLASDPKVLFQNCSGFINSGNIVVGGSTAQDNLIPTIFHSATNLNGMSPMDVAQTTRNNFFYEGGLAAGIDLSRLRLTLPGSGMKYNNPAGTFLSSDNISKSVPVHLWLRDFGDSFDFSGRSGTFIQDSTRNGDLVLDGSTGLFRITTTRNITANGAQINSVGPGTSSPDEYGTRPPAPALTSVVGSITLNSSNTNGTTLSGTSVAVNGGVHSTLTATATSGNLDLVGTNLGSMASLNAPAGTLTLNGVSMASGTLKLAAKEVKSSRLKLDAVIQATTGSLPWALSGWTSNAQFNLTHNATENTNPDKKTQATTVLDKFVFRSGGNITVNSGAVELKACTASAQLKAQGLGELIIDGGAYQGNPAVVGSNIVVKRGTFTDTGFTSQFLVDPDSEATTSVSGDKTITTVKLSNPPIIIDWEEFPGLDIDLSAPIIEVIRDPVNIHEPTDKVELTIKATDPNGADHETPISINGGAFQASPATHTVTENQIVSIVARDANGNVREYQVNITNIDSQPPEITGFTQSNSEWTKDPIKVYVDAKDDVKLDLTPYKFEFQPNRPEAGLVVGEWQSDRGFKVTENGTLWVTVRDTTGKQTKSDPYMVRNIDTIPPSAMYEINPKSDVKVSPNDGVVIELQIQNIGDPVTEEASPISAVAVKWSETEAWSSDTSRRVYENGVYNIRVRDSVGNVSNPIPITVSNISTDKPVIESFTGNHMLADYVMAPVELKVTARGSGSTPLHAKPYSWDGGKTWTSLNTFNAMQNGEYNVQVRDQAGTTAEASIIITNIDAVKPTASVFLYKGLPDDGSGEGPDDYVWKIRVEASDIGSGIDHIQTLWDGGTHTSMPITQDVLEPGVYGVLVYDKAGNQTYAEKTVTAESIGEATGSGSNGAYVDIKVPQGGTAGSHFNASIGDLVYGPTGAYNKVTSEFKTYASGQVGITAHLVVNAKAGTWVTGYATFNSVKYPVTFSNAEGAKGGKNMAATVHIPMDTLTQDTRNGRLVVVIQEWKSSAKSELKREGSATLYTSVQVTPPKINYTYNRATDEMTIVATSSVAGISSNTYNLGGGSQKYETPFSVGNAGTVILSATDNVQNTTELKLNGKDLPLAGEGGGSLPTEGIQNPGSLQSYYTAGRASESYILNGNRTNTEQVPSSSIFESILGGSGTGGSDG